ncbi:MAG: hypothetical protein IT372_29640 [Polyangiaceae bacterium]|nr:hypothetical protein [Polyangiaceae bacterium]
MRSATRCWQAGGRRERYGHDPRVVVRFEIAHVPDRGRRLGVTTGVLREPPPS